MTTRRRNASTTLAALALLLALAACDRPPSADSLQVWSKADHHSTDDERLAAAASSASAAPPGGAKGGGDAQLVDVTWRQQCAGCHGPLGQGNGPMGPMLQAPDLTSREWQAKVSDAEILATIRDGRNKMPRFGLPESVLKGLVARIRSLRGP